MRKKIIILLVVGTLLFVGYIFKSHIQAVINQILIDQKKVTLPVANEYKRHHDFLFIQNTTDFKPKTKQDLLNIYFTILNSGWDEFTFYCPPEYKKCLSDLKKIASDNTLLSHLNNFVHPFNSYQEIKTRYNTMGLITIMLDKTYPDGQKLLIKNKANDILNDIIKPSMTSNEKIKVIHDYIIRHTKYAVNYESNKKDRAQTSYGVLFNGYGTCNGYADTLAIFLDMIEIKNYKIASDTHVWNYVYVDNKWYHLDVAWNDPVTEDGEDIISDTFYLITTEKLKDMNIKDHDYPSHIYLEK
ncbi:MAG: transglutaminase domain-containing protein [Bacilli bacterium]|jgi:hypothetical protein|nr:transglutaminase domain-containing protein [Bacilli bacterium]